MNRPMRTDANKPATPTPGGTSAKATREAIESYHRAKSTLDVVMSQLEPFLTRPDDEERRVLFEEFNSASSRSDEAEADLVRAILGWDPREIAAFRCRCRASDWSPRGVIHDGKLYQILFEEVIHDGVECLFRRVSVDRPEELGGSCLIWHLVEVDVDRLIDIDAECQV